MTRQMAVAVLVFVATYGVVLAAGLLGAAR